MNKIVNILPIDATTFESQEYSLDDNSLISNFEESVQFDPTTNYLEYFVYDLNSNLLYSNVFGYRNYKLIDNKVVLDPQQDLENLGFEEGQYNTVYNFLNPLLSSNPANRLYIEEISSDRTELRLNTTSIPNELLVAGASLLQQLIAEPTATYRDFYLNFGDNKLVIANNVLVDNTNPDDPTILINLYEPLSPEFDIKSELWVVDKVAEPIAYNIELTVIFELEDDSIQLRGPNTNISVKDQINNSTDYTNFSSLTATTSVLNTSSLRYQLNSILEERGIEINVDYTDYSNFVYLSSAQTRLENFYYKLQLLEQYQLSSSYSSGTLNYYTSGSQTYWQNKIDEIITTFDGYEYYLYYESGSKAWPKSNSVPPYINYSTTNINATTWLNTQLAVASLYDSENNNALINTIPEYLREDPNNEKYELFVEMIGQHFDSIWVYFKDVTNKFNADNRLNYGISKDLVAQAIRDFGVKLYQNNFSVDNLYSAFLGYTPSSSLYNFPYTTGSLPTPSGLEYINNYVTASSTSSLIPLDDVNKEIYKRIYHNLPFLLKKKGTVEGLRALANIYGIPDTVLRVNEFGGKDKNFNTWDNWQDEFNYTFYTTGSGQVNIPFKTSATAFGSTFPKAIELRFKTEGLPTSSIPYSQSIMFNSAGNVGLLLEYTGSGYVSASYSSSAIDSYYQYATLKFITGSLSASVYLPFYDGGWWSVLINAASGSTTTYTLYAKNKLYDGEDGNLIGFQASSSFTASNFWSNVGASNFVLSTGSVYGGKTYTKFSGSIQEFRYYTTPISESNFDAYVMNPYSIESNPQTTLMFRLPLGGELYTGSASVHPAITGSYTPTQSFSSAPYTASFTGNYSFAPNVEVIYFDQLVAGIKNIVSDKVKAVDTVLPYSSNDANIPTNTVLSPYISIQQNFAASSSYTKDIDYVEVAFSPQNEINEDINSQFGYINIGDYIGDPRQVSESLTSYPDLDKLRDEYFSKYTHNYDIWDYIRLIKYFDNSLFKMIQDFTPARTSLATGVVIKQHLLERNKYPLPQLTQSNHYYTGSIGSVPSMSNDEKIYISSTDYTSIPLYTFEGGNGGAYNITSTVDQSWSGSYETPSGSVGYIQSNQEEFFTGELSGSTTIVTTQSLLSNPFLYDPNLQLTIKDLDTFSAIDNTLDVILTTASINTPPFSINLSLTQNSNINAATIFEVEDDPYNRFALDYNGSTYYQSYNPAYDSLQQFNITLIGSASITSNSGGTLSIDSFTLFLVETDSSRNITNILSEAEVFSTSTALSYPTPGFTRHFSSSVNLSCVFPVKSGFRYGLAYSVTHDHDNGTFDLTYMISPTSSFSNDILEIPPVYLDPYQIDTNILPYNISPYIDYLPTLNCISLPRLSQYFMDVDYSQNSLIPVNQQLLLSGSAQKAPVQDSYYTLTRHINPRYNGSRLTSANYTFYSPSGSNTEFADNSIGSWDGDISYGKTAVIDYFNEYFAYFEWIGASYPEVLNAGNVCITKLIDKEGNIISLGDNSNIELVENIFKQNTDVLIYFISSSVGVSNFTSSVYDGGALISTKLAITSPTFSLFISNEQQSTSFTYLAPFFGDPSGGGDPFPTSIIFNTADITLWDYIFNPVSSSTVISASGGDFYSSIITPSSSLGTYNNFTIFRAWSGSTTTYDANEEFNTVAYKTFSKNIKATTRGTMSFYPSYDANVLGPGNINGRSQRFRIIKREPNDNFVVISPWNTTQRGSGLLVPRNYNPELDYIALARKAGLIS